MFTSFPPAGTLLVCKHDCGIFDAPQFRQGDAVMFLEASYCKSTKIVEWKFFHKGNIETMKWSTSHFLSAMETGVWSLGAVKHLYELFAGFEERDRPPGRSPL